MVPYSCVMQRWPPQSHAPPRRRGERGGARGPQVQAHRSAAARLATSPIPWLIVLVSAVAATLATLTTSAAQTTTRASHTMRSVEPPAATVRSQDAKPAALSAVRDGVYRYDFEDAEGALDGWTAAGTATLGIDDTVARGGKRSLRLTPHPDRARRYLEARATIGDIADLTSLRGASITCRMRPSRELRAAANAHAGLVVEDAGAGLDFSHHVVLADTDRSWVRVSMIVGATGETAVDGSTVFQSARFDGATPAKLGVFVNTDDAGPLADPVHIDSCVIDASLGTVRSNADRIAAAAAAGPHAAGRYDGGVSVPEVPAAGPSPDTPETQVVDREARPGDDGQDRFPDEPSAGAPDVQPGIDEHLVTYDFEASDTAESLSGWTASDGATLRIDDSVGRHGSRSLRAIPSPGDAGYVGVAAELGALVDAPSFTLGGATIRCHVNAGVENAGPGAHAGLVILDGHGGLDYGPTVTVTDGAWTEVSLTVGARGERGHGGETVAQTPGFDGDAVTTLGIHVAADSGPITRVNVDDCVIDGGS